MKIQRCLLQLSNGGVMHKPVYKETRPTGSLRPRLYGLSKVHKKEVPLRPILSMVDSSQNVWQNIWQLLLIQFYSVTQTIA